MRMNALSLVLIMICAGLSGCLGGDDVDIEEDPNDPNPSGNIGFMDNSSVYGFRFNGTTLERVMVITETACNDLIAQAAANTDADFIFIGILQKAYVLAGLLMKTHQIQMKFTCMTCKMKKSVISKVQAKNSAIQ